MSLAAFLIFFVEKSTAKSQGKLVSLYFVQFRRLCKKVGLALDFEQ